MLRTLSLAFAIRWDNERHDRGLLHEYTLNSCISKGRSTYYSLSQIDWSMCDSDSCCDHAKG